MGGVDSNLRNDLYSYLSDPCVITPNGLLTSSLSTCTLYEGMYYRGFINSI